MLQLQRTFSINESNSFNDASSCSPTAVAVAVAEPTPDRDAPDFAVGSPLYDPLQPLVINAAIASASALASVSVSSFAFGTGDDAIVGVPSTLHAAAPLTVTE